MKAPNGLVSSLGVINEDETLDSDQVMEESSIEPEPELW